MQTGGCHSTLYLSPASQDDMVEELGLTETKDGSGDEYHMCAAWCYGGDRSTTNYNRQETQMPPQASLKNVKNGSRPTSRILPIHFLNIYLSLTWLRKHTYPGNWVEEEDPNIPMAPTKWIVKSRRKGPMFFWLPPLVYEFKDIQLERTTCHP